MPRTKTVGEGNHPFGCSGCGACSLVHLKPDETDPVSVTDIDDVVRICMQLERLGWKTKAKQSGYDCHVCTVKVYCPKCAAKL